MKVIKLHKNPVLNDRQVVKQLKAENREMQHLVYQYYAPNMLSVCRQYIKDLQHAEDVLLNGFLKVFTKINTYNQKGSFEGWIRKIMINECISYLRIKKNTFITDKFKDKPIAEEETQKRINTDKIQLAIDALKPELRLVFNLFVIEEYKHKEIAEILNITENASKLRYRKAKQQIKKSLKNKKSQYGK